jgi:amino acid adenylation domain-containing protein
VSAASVFHLAWARVLGSLSNRDDVVFGTILFGRMQGGEGAERVMGMLINTLPVRIEVKNHGVEEAVKKTHQILTELLYHEHATLALAQRCSGVVSPMPLFSSLLNYRYISMPVKGEKNKKSGDGIESLYSEERTNYPFSMSVNDFGEAYSLTAQGQNPIDPNRICRYMNTVLERFADALENTPYIAVGSIDVLSEPELNQILFEWNETYAEYPDKKCIHELFEEQVDKTPDAVALVFENESISYWELNRRSNQLAYYLRSLGIKLDDTVGICMERSLDMIICFLGILKAGVTYLPIEKEIPSYRIISTLNDSNCKVLLTKNNIAKDVPFTELQNLQYLRSEDFVVTKQRSRIQELDTLPFPDRSMVDSRKFNKFIGQACVKDSILILSSRGCPYGCTYCDKIIWGRKYFYRSAENIFGEVQNYYHMGYRKFVFADDIFNLNKDSEKFFKLIIMNNLKLQILFPSGLRGDILSPDYIDLMSEAGVIQFVVALETASPRLQKLIKKNLNIEKLKENINYICKKHPHIILDLFTMIGFPTETEEEALMTFDFIRDIKWIHFPYINVLKIIPGTEMAAFALDYGITNDDINRNGIKRYHEIPDYIPFSKSFVSKYQSQMFSEYFLLPERLMKVLAVQKQILTHEEIVDKYNSYLPGGLEKHPEIVSIIGDERFANNRDKKNNEIKNIVKNNSNCIQTHISNTAKVKDNDNKENQDRKLRILLLDLSQRFSQEIDNFYDVVDPPLGLMYLMTYLNQKFEGSILGKIQTSRVDFDSFNELKNIVNDFKPDIIGIRTLNCFKDFFHLTVSLLRHWGIDTPIIAGGPYASSNFSRILSDMNVDVCVLGEGEVTFSELVGAIIENDGRLPDNDKLSQIAGLAFVPKNSPVQERLASKRKIIMLDKISGINSCEAASNPLKLNHAEQPAYIIYTSGSTGRPKGVIGYHQGLCNLEKSQVKNYNVRSSSRILQYASLSFDVSILEIILALCSGSTLCMARKDLLIPGSTLEELLNKHNITHIWMPPSALSHLNPESIKTVQTIGVGGESCSHSLAAQWYDKLQLINGYGPTEYSVHTSILEYTNIESDISIGRPINNTKTYILDSQMQPVPKKVFGELHVTGVGLSYGYNNRPELTAERFVPDPFNKSGSRLYKTGDLVSYFEDGNIEFISRIDYQVKIRGYRIELGEIESGMRNIDGIKEAVVLAREDTSGDKRLVAYYTVLENIEEITVEDIRSHLLKHLPNYMIPSAFVMLEELPLTPNGKTDRKSLPAPDEDAYARGVYETPVGDVEEELSRIWSEVLNVERVSRNDNFFDLGGHSLLIIKVHGKIKDLFKKEIKVVDLFTYPTIKLLSNFIDPETYSDQNIVEKEHIATRTEKYEPIAVIGMVCRFPGIRNVEEYWVSLRDGKESISRYTDEELLSDSENESLLNNPVYVKAGSLLDDIDIFDAAFFGFSPRHAEITDPQHRLFLECAHEVLECSGYAADSRKNKIGVFVGSGSSQYLHNNIRFNPSILEYIDPFQIMISNDKDFLASLVSYKLNLDGPSLNIQTACSTSLVATHVACQSLLNYECDIALAGGVSINSFQKRGYLYNEGGIMSPDGHCRAFDSEANGSVPGSGMGIVVLKRLRDALADGDNIDAVIKGSAINNDGSLKVGYTASSVVGQSKVIRRAQALADISSDTISYIETHGTGTVLGDPIEIKALTRAFREDTEEKGFCAVGSVKTNIGHADTAAGVAGLIKTVLALKHKQIPASLNFKKPNPEIDFENSPFYVNTELSEWKSNCIPRRAGVSSFGMGGTNAHVILEEAPSLTDPDLEYEKTSRPYQIISLSAMTSSALDRMNNNLLEHLERHSDLNISDVAYSLHVGRKSFDHRRIIVCRDRDEALALLGNADSERVITRQKENERQNIVFMFPGQGAQYVNMGRDLYQNEQIFRDDINFCAEVLEPHLGLDLRKIIFPGANELEKASEQLEQTSITQPALFIIEYALSKLIISWGIRPSAMIGHSIGEYVAACLSGVFSLEDCLELVALRGRLIQGLPKGSMLAVPLSEEKLKPLLGKDISIAAVNSPDQCTVSGPSEKVKSFKDMMGSKGIICIDLHTSHAFHSEMTEPVLKEYGDHVKRIYRNPPRIPFISNVTGTWVTEQDAINPDYWASHIRNTVRFADGIEELFKTKDQIMLEVGPGRTLKTLAMQHTDIKPEHVALSTIRHPRDKESDISFLLTTLGRLWVEGVKIDWPEYYRHEEHHRVVLPTYPFEKQRYWIDAQPVSLEAVEPKAVLTKNTDISDWFYEPVWEVSRLRQLSIQGETGNPELTWLVFIDESGIGEGLIERLKQENKKIITVKAADGFVKEDDYTFNINPGVRDDYDFLIHVLKSNEITLSRIVHLWSVYERNDNNTYYIELNQSQSLGCYSLIYLAQAINKAGFTKDITINVISNNMQEVTGVEDLYPEKSTLMGPVTVIPQECPNIQCRSIDIDLVEAQNDSSQKIIEKLLLELKNDPSDLTIVYRGKYRWIKKIKSIQIDKSYKKDPIKENGTYLITGGLGNIGLELAEDLAKKARVKLVLTSRSIFPEKKEWTGNLNCNEPDNPVIRKIRKLQRIEELGSEIMLVNLDVSEKSEMEKLISNVEERFGRINGVFHAAGKVDLNAFKPVHDIEKFIFEYNYGPKIEGLLNLEDVFKERKLDFCVLFSSLSSILGGIGYAAYSSANLFMDSFVRKYNRTASHPWISINFDGWNFLFDEMKNKSENIPATEILSMTPEEGVETIYRILSTNNLDQVIISTGNLHQRYNKWVKLESKREINKTTKAKSLLLHKRPELSTPYIEPVNETEKIIVDIWQELLGIEMIGVEDNFFDLGGDSLLVVKLIDMLKRKKIIISVDKIFTYPTIKKIVEYLKHDNQHEGAIPLRIVEGVTPLFLTYEGTGQILYATPLTSKIDEDISVYGLTFPSYDVASLKTIQSQAMRLISIIKTIQPKGPYRIAGWSFGGIIAYEIASQLLGEDETIEFLGLIDMHNYTHEAKSLSSMNDSEMLIKIMADKEVKLSSSEQMKFDAGTLTFEMLVKKCKEEKIFPDEFNFEQIRHRLNVARINGEAYRNYSPSLIPVTMHLFRANEGEYHELYLGWDSILPERQIKVIPVPGTHMSMMSPANIGVLGLAISEAINQITAISAGNSF